MGKNHISWVETESVLINLFNKEMLLCTQEGNIISNRKGSLKVLKPAKNKQGYLCFSSSWKDKKFTYPVHRVVWTFFNGVIPKGMVINHISGKKDENSIHNLELVTPSENTLHAYRIGLKSNRGEKCPISVLTEDQVLEIVKLSKKVPSPTQLGKLFDVSRCTISDIFAGRSWAYLTGIKPRK